jgi:hypothetical protein
MKKIILGLLLMLSITTSNAQYDVMGDLNVYGIINGDSAQLGNIRLSKYALDSAFINLLDTAFYARNSKLIQGKDTLTLRIDTSQIRNLKSFVQNYSINDTAQLGWGLTYFGSQKYKVDSLTITTLNRFLDSIGKLKVLINNKTDTTKTPNIGHLSTQFDRYIDNKRVDDSLALIYTQGQVDTKLALKLNKADTTNFLDKADSSGFKLETKTSNAIKLGTKADTSVVNDTTYAIRQMVNSKLSSVSHDITLTGVGTAVNPLKVDTTLIGTNKAIHDSVIFNLTGVLVDRGDWNPVGNLFPSTSINMGDKFTVITTPAFLGGTDSVWVGSVLIARVNTPGQVSTNWNIINSHVIGVNTTPQLFNSSTKGPLHYNGRVPLAGTIHGGSAAPIGTKDTININGLLYTSGKIQTTNYIYAGSYMYVGRYTSTYPSTVYTNSGFSVSPGNATNAVKVRFGSSTISTTVWNTTPTAVSERHTYRQTIDAISGTSPVSYLNFGFFKDAGTELIASRLGMTGDWSHLLGANTDYLTSYTGGTVSTPVTDNKRFSAKTTGLEWYNYTSGNWSRIMDLSNTGHVTLAGGLSIPKDTILKLGNASISNTRVSTAKTYNFPDSSGTIALLSNLGNTLVGSQSIKIAGDSVALGDTIFKPMINIIYKENTLNQENYAYGTLSVNQYNYVDNDTSSNINNETIGYMSHNQQNYTTGIKSFNFINGTQGDSSHNMQISTYGSSAYNLDATTYGNGSIPIVVNAKKCDTLAMFEKNGVVKTKITSYGIETNALITKYDTLSATSTVITYDAATNPFRTDTIGESHTYHINGAVNGSKGMLNVTITSTATLSFPAGVLADGQTFTSLAAGVYNICWEKVQGTFQYNIHKYSAYTGY